MTGLRTYIALVVFLGSYFVFTVLGNLIYFTPIGDSLGAWSRVGFSIRNFEFAGSFGYWSLLLLPFIVAPPVAIAAKAAFSQVARRAIPLPSVPIFLVITAVCYGFAGWSLWRADAYDLLFQGSTSADAAESRFELMASLGFWPLVVIKAVLVTFSIFAIVTAIRERTLFWLVMVCCNVVGMTILLALLNAKWPLVLFYVSHLIAIVLFAPRPLLPGCAFAALAVASYCITSMVLLRAVPVEQVNVQTQRQAASQHKTVSPERVQSVAALTLLAPINRMAQPFSYYFDTFTREPGKCGSIADRIRRASTPCHPSNLIYAEMFNDRFAGIGTAPQAVHVTGYALGGWAGALIELAIASIILGAFAAIATARGVIADTLTVLGALTGYFFSQLPVEGPIVYDHGLLWAGLSLVGLSFFASASSCMMRARALPKSS